MQVNMNMVNVSAGSDSRETVKKSSTSGSSSDSGLFQSVMSKAQQSTAAISQKSNTADNKTVNEGNNTLVLEDSSSDMKKIQLEEEASGEKKENSIFAYEDIMMLISALLDGKISLDEINGKIKGQVSDSLKKELQFMNIDIDPDKIQKIVDESFNVIQKNTSISNTEDMKNLLNQALSKLNDEISMIVKQTSEAKGVPIKNTDELMKNIRNDISAALRSNIEEIDKKHAVNSKADIINDIGTMLRKDMINSANKASNSSTDRNHSNLEEKKSNSIINEKNSSISSKSEKTKDDNILKALTSSSSKEEDKIARVANFMSQISDVKTESPAVSVDNVVINKNNMANDMIKAIKYMETNDIKNLTVKIVPKELGEVIIKLTMENGVMKANITATNKEAYNILNSNLQEMNSKLSNSDIKIQNFTINIYNEDTTFFRQESNGRDTGSQGKHGERSRVNSVDEEESEIINPSEVDSNIDMMA